MATLVTLSFSMYVYDFFGANGAIDPSGLDHTTGGSSPTRPNQHARVDLLALGAGAFDTNANSVLQNFYLGVDPEASQNPPEAAVYRNYFLDLTDVALPGMTYQLRFGAVDNQFALNQAVDNVSVLASEVIPEPATLALAVFGLLPGWAATRRHSGRLRRR